MRGHSKLRNRAIANVFSQIGLVEAWGTGLQRIQTAAGEYGLKVEFVELPESFRVNMYRNVSPSEEKDGGENPMKFGESSVKFGESSVKEELNGTTKQIIIKLIQQNSRVSAAMMAEKLSLSTRALEKNLKALREEGILIRHGSARGGYWEIRK